jgi:hypothetical protein
MLILSGCSDGSLTAVDPRIRLKPALGPDCQEWCVVLDADLTLRPFQAVGDSARRMDLAEVALRGQPGDTVAVFIEADDDFLKTLPESEVLAVGTSATELVRPLRTFSGLVQVYRFHQSEEITLRYTIARHAPVSGRGKVKLTQITSAKVVGSRRPWAGEHSSSFAADVDPLLCVNGLSISGNGTECGVTYTFSRVAPPEAYTVYGSQFQSDPGTSDSHDIVVTFSKPVTGIAVGIYDPTYVGNFVAVYDSLGNEIGNKQFAAFGPDVTFSVDNAELHGSISKVLLHPAAGDYVVWALYIIVAPGCHVSVPLFKQSSPAPWGHDTYDHTTYTVGQKGCALTSLTMAIQARGPISDDLLTPGDVNRLLTSTPTQQFNRGGNMLWANNVAFLTGGAFVYRPVSDTASMRRELCDGNAVIVGVKLGPKGPGHFVLVTGIEGDGTFTINDPATGTQRPLADYGDYSFRGAIAPRALPAPTATRLTSNSSGIAADVVQAPNGGALQIVASNAAVAATDVLGRQTSFNAMTGDSIVAIPDSHVWRDHLDNDETGEVDSDVAATIHIGSIQPGTYRIDITPTQTVADSAYVSYLIPGVPMPPVTILRFNAIAGNTISYDAAVGDGSLVVVPSVKPHVLAKYLCGNTFGIRNKNGVAIDVSYIVTTGERGVLQLPPRPANSPYSQVTFTTVTTGDVSIYAYGTLVATRLNEGRACH